MPRANSPFLTSISGSLRGGPTFRATSQTPDIVMQTRPVPTDRRTAKQAAVRDAYSRLAYLWKNLSHLDKEPYEIMAEARNLTPWNCWLSFHMPILRLSPRLYLPFSEGAGTTLQDFSIGGLTGTINGPSYVEKNGFPALSFDGVDDRVTFARPGYYDCSTDLTFFCLFTSPPSNNRYNYLLGSNTGPGDKFGHEFIITQENDLIFIEGNGTTRVAHLSSAPVPLNQLNSLAIIKSGIKTTKYVNGRIYTDNTGLSSIAPNTYNYILGALATGVNPTQGIFHLIATFPTAFTVPAIVALDTLYRPFFT